MTATLEDRRKLLQTIAKLPGGLEQLNAIYLDALRGRPGRFGMSREQIDEQLIEEILRLEFDGAERP
jgi:hypothetical protein